jgi:glycosyltransferase involved in cell wall biosynthesis
MISIVIPTFNRANRLQELLESIGRMHRPAHLAWEVVVVDNNSNDATPDVAGRFVQRDLFPVRYVFEGKQGISHARNRGVMEARGSVIACVDDDCVVHESWLAEIADEFARDEQLMMLGGRVELFDPADAPMTVRTGRKRLDLTDDVTAFEHLIGCNLAFRRAAHERVGGFDPRYGAGSGLLPSNEDSEFAYRVVSLGGRVVYAPDVVVYHHHGRRDPEVLSALRWSYAAGRGGFYVDYIGRADLRILRMACTELVERLATMLSPRTGASRRADQVQVLRALWDGAGLMLRSPSRRRRAAP